MQKASRLVRLGATPPQALEAARSLLGADLETVQAALELHLATGADPVPLLERASVLISRRADSESASRAAAAGAKLSGWMVGGLPLVSLPLLPMAHAPLFDTAGLTLLFLGFALTGVGMFWMARLVPAARPTDDPFAVYADHVSAALHAGAGLSIALDLAARSAPGELRTDLRRARRRVRLGRAWPEALIEVSPRFGEMTAAVGRAERSGSPISPVLAVFAEARRKEAERDFERAVRRAPVLMVLPLVLCVLPAFGLLAVVPFLRGLTLG